MISLILAAALASPLISNAEIRPTYRGGHTTAAYMTVTSPAQDRLLSVSCDCADRVEIHRTVVEGGVARMTGPEPVEVPAGRPVVFAPGGRHLMVMGLKAEISPGKVVTMTLHFEKAGPVTTGFKAPKQATPSADHMDHMDHMGDMDHMDHNH